ncbi:MAG: ATP-binding protein [Clostridia bacterium]|nr:ATP-binding protein [Clostridia bacterium]
MGDQINLSMEDYEICSKLKNMRFSGMAQELENLFSDPNADLLPFREKVSRLVDAEWELRYTKKLNRFIKKASLKYPSADLDDTIYDPERQLNGRMIEELAKCSWIEQGRNLMITGQTGSGKSYIANALCICALRQFKAVRYIRASHMIDELNKAETLGTYREYFAQVASYDLLAIDDFGLMQLDLNKCRNLFEVLESRDPHKSTMVISQFPVKSWYDLFQEHTYADACLTRLLNSAYRLEMNGKNMRNLKPINQ